MKEKKTAEFIGAIIGAVIGMTFVNSVLFWRQYTDGVILKSWADILWAANLSMMVQILGNFVLAFYRPARLYWLLQGIIAIAGLISVIVFFNVFPLDFSQVGAGWLNILTKVAMIAAMFGTSIGILVYLVRTVLGTQYKPAQDK